MLGLNNAKALVGLLTLFLAYLFTIAPAGCFRTWVAKKMGDSTADDLGFMTLNPLVHVDMFGLIWLLLFSRPEYFSGFGWGKHIPINPANIQGRWRTLKISCAFFSDSFAHFVMAALAFSAASLLFVERAASNSVDKIYSTSFELVIFQILFAFVSLNIFLVLVQAVINGVILIALHATNGSIQTASYLYYFVLFAPLVILILFGNELRQVLYYAIAAVEHVIAACFGSSHNVVISSI